MDIIEFKPRPEEYAWTFGGAAPLRKVVPGSLMRLWTEDAFGGRLTSRTDRASDKLGGDLNPQTGPFYVEGAAPGDTLVLHLVGLEPARDWGASCTIPFFGGLTSTPLTPTLQRPLEELTWIYQLDRAKRSLRFEALRSELVVDLPLEPMLGTVGVAPAAREVRTSLVPGNFGGNMDTPEMRTGATVYLGVNVEGALFSVGDGHYRQGEGESCGTAVEGAMNVALLVGLIKGRAPVWPRMEDDEYLMVVGSTRPLEEAWRASQVGMVEWLHELYGLDRLDAYQLLTQVSQSPIANVVDTNYSVMTKIAKRFLPSARAYDGMHQHLQGIAATV
jgi:acetamidase/formamidase